MFESIASSLESVFKKLRGQGALSEKNIQDGLREVRRALLEADVNFQVARDFIKNVTERAIGQEVIRSVTPGQQIVKIVHDELVKLMGPVDATVPKFDDRPTVVMMCGLQGQGKTTTSAKFARLMQKKGRRPMLVAADVKRPAAVEQLRQLGAQVGVPIFSEPGVRPPVICEHALSQASRDGLDLLILDTAGRLHIDEEMMEEVREVSRRVKPDLTWLVCNAQTGQDAVNSAKEFNEQLKLDGVVLTMLDGDSRGGAALSVKAVTGKPIVFAGVGEKVDQFEEFRPESMANRILGMGDIVGLVERAQATVDAEKQLEFQKKMREATWTLEDFRQQLQQVRKMGPVKELLEMIPGLGKQLKGIDIDEKDFRKIEAMIQSMTPKEKMHPDVIEHSRRRRIAAGSATEPSDVNQLIKQFKTRKKMMKKMGTAPGKMKGFRMPGLG